MHMHFKGVLLIFTQERSVTKFTHDTEEFYNPKITKVEVTVEGVPNELYAQNMEYRHQYDEIVKHFAEGQLKETGAIQKDLQLHNVNIASYYTDKYALWTPRLGQTIRKHFRRNSITDNQKG